MIRHIVGFRFKPDTTPEQVADFLAAFRCLGEQIPELRSLWVGPNLTDRDRSFPYVLNGSFDDMAAVGRYLVHPAHVEALATYLTPILEQRVILDIEE
ncbi:MAG TPA: Dabb family protein [Stenomitos sp.]